MIGTKYLSEAVDINNLETEKLNIIKSPTGSGKTYFALHEISSLCKNALHQAVYLIDTINGKEQILRNYNATECNKYWLRDIEGDYLWFQEDSRVVIMTYAKFGFILSTKPEFYNYFDYIICDELHSLIRFQYFSQLPNYHSIAKEGLERAATNSKTTVIALTATPEIVKKEFNTAIHELPVSEDVRHYETTEVVRYTNLNALVSSINATDKIGICYVTRITAMKELNALAVKLGYAPICIWSTSNQDHHMTDEQLAVRKQILEDFTIPEKYNLLIINASCGTSIKLKSRVDYIIINSSTEDTQVQVRGRYTGDLDIIYLPAIADMIQVKMPDAFLGRRLFREDKEKLCRILNIRNSRNNRLCGWTTIRRILIDSDYQILDARFQNRHYSIITVFKEE